MGKSLPGSACPYPTRPRLAVTGGLLACVWLWAFASAFAVAPTANPPASAYQRALDAFNHEDYPQALSLLQQASADGVKGSRARADAFNLKGAVLLRQGRYAEAKAAFDEAADTDPKLWAAHYNKGEVDFREKRYAASHRQFGEVLDRTSRLWQGPERHFIEYKLMLTDLLGGNEKPAADFIAAHAADEPPPLAWYYLSAALDYRHGQPAVGEAYLQEAGKNHAVSSRQVYADSFDTLGWSARRTGASPGRGRAATGDEPATALAKTTLDRQDKRLSARPVSKTLAVVQLLPETDAPPAVGARAKSSVVEAPAAHTTGAANMPPSEAGMTFQAFDEGAALTRASSSPVASVLARRRAHPSPSPSASPADSPAAGSTDGASSSPLPSPDESASPSPSSSPNGTPSPAFIQKYEAAMVQFLQKNYPETKRLLDEADAIQPNQPNSVGLRNQLFKQYYEAAYAAYQHADYVGALSQLDGADGVGSNAQNQSDAYNLRGLVLSKQRNYPEAENMFHKAIQTDPGLWAAKFNYAEVPFNYRNFTVARTRFEELFSQTDPVKQPVEAELTQFKVFLTLLLEGKEDAARTFMQHFNFSGATPARYFCQAALNFYTGEVDKAQGWIDSARKEYPARKSSSFLEAFYRVGWLTDPNAPAAGVPATALAAAAPAPTVAPAPVAATSPSPTPAASPAKTALAAASPAPILPARPTPALAASPSPTPVAVASATPVATPAIAKATPTPIASAVPTPALVKATPVPASTVMPSPTAPAIAKIPVPTAAPSPTAPAVAKVPVVPAAPSPSAPVVALTTPRPATPAPVASLPAATSSPAAEAEATPAETAQPAAGGGGDLLRLVIVGAVALYSLYVIGRIVLSVMNPKPKRTGKASASGNRKTAEADQIEAPRR